MTVEDIGWNLQRESIAFSRLLVFSWINRYKW